MKQNIVYRRIYHYIDDNGKPNKLSVNYSIEYINGNLISIRNEYGFLVEKNSEVWEYFFNLKF